MKRVLGLTLAVLASPVLAKPHLSQVAPVNDGLIIAGMAIELAEHCGSRDLRILRGVAYLAELKAKARKMGYSNAEIEAYVEDDVVKSGLEDEARARLEALGVVPGDGASYCAVASAQISAGNTLGSLLR